MPAVKTDIEHFYPSVSFNHVRRFFKDAMNCTGDIAYLLAKICCYKNKHLPTGGVHSEVLAFYCAKPCFDAVDARAKDLGGVMTTYVDDIMVSAPCASDSDLRWMKRTFAQRGLTLHGADKSRVYRKNERKTITGVCIHHETLRAPQRQHMAIRERFADMRKTSLQDADRVHVARSLVGHLDHVQQIDARYAHRAKANRARLKTLMKEDHQ